MLGCGRETEQPGCLEMEVEHFDYQVHDVQASVLRSIGDFLIKDDLGSIFGIGLPHRHFEVKQVSGPILQLKAR